MTRCRAPCAAELLSVSARFAGVEHPDKGLERVVHMHNSPTLSSWHEH